MRKKRQAVVYRMPKKLASEVAKRLAAVKAAAAEAESAKPPSYLDSIRALAALDSDQRKETAEEAKGILSEALAIRDIAKLFMVSERTMRDRLDEIRAQRFGDRYRIPIRNMPPAYFAARGIPLSDAQISATCGNSRQSGKSTE